MTNHSVPKKILIVCLVLIALGAPISIFSQNVNPDGSFSYSYPISLPPGTNGVAPSLALVYNSNSGNGMCGVGWSLAGLSVIGRDGSYPVAFNDFTDHFSFNGQRLIPDATDADVFHTENESYVRIKAISDGDFITHWEVTMKNGMKMFYGYDDADHVTTNDGNIAAVDKGGKALLWSLSRVEDVNGNYYVVEYFENAVSGGYYPLKITYTKGAGIAKFTTVEFYYQYRSDQGNVYVPTKMNFNYRLKWITVKIGDTTQSQLLRKYRLDYKSYYIDGTQYNSETTYRSQLIQIIEYGNDGNSPIYATIPGVISNYQPTGSTLPATNFTWTTDALNFGNWTDYESGFHSGTEIATGDFDGDGTIDLVNWKKDLNTTSTVWLSNVVNGEIDPVSLDERNNLFVMPTPSPVLYPPPPLGVPTPDMRFYMEAKIMPGDFNGDGTTDIMTISEQQSIRIYLVENGVINTTPCNNSIFHGKVEWRAGDFNGDGITDILAYDKIEGGIWLHPVIDGIIQSATDSGTDFHNGSDIYTADFNGDGTTDILTRKNDTGQTWINLVKDGDIQSYSCYSASCHEEFAVFPGDFNGDGTTDLYFWKASGRYYLNLVENGVIITTSPDYSESFHESSSAHIVVGDYNGDGTDDLFFWLERGEQWLHPVKFGHVQPWVDHDTSVHEGFDQVFCSNVDGNGTGDFVFWRKSDCKIYLHPTQIPITDKIISITSGSGGTVAINYTPAPQLDGTIDAAGAVYPDIANSSPRALVTSVVSGDGLGHAYTTAYDYHNGRVITGPITERKNLGFEWIEKTDPSGLKTKTWYSHDPEYPGLPEKEEVFGSDGKRYKETTAAYGRKLVQAATSTHRAVYFSYKEDEYTKSWYNGNESEAPVETRTQFAEYDTGGNLTSYDAYGNQVKVVSHGDLSTTADDTYLYTEYASKIDATTYLFVPVRSVKYCWNNATSSWELAQETKLYYDGYNASHGTIGLKGQVTKKEERRDASSFITMMYEYDDWGNLLRSKDPRAAGGAYTAWTRIAEYDANFHAYPIATKTYTGQTGANEYFIEQIVYDTNLMWPIQTIDVNGVSTYTDYDVFGRVVATRGLEDSVSYPGTMIEYHDAMLDANGEIDTPAYSVSKKKITGSTTGGMYSEARAYADGLGRKLQEKVKKSEAVWITTSYLYDSSGRNYAVTVPYETSGSGYAEPPAGTVVSSEAYDAIGRVIRKNNTDTTYSRYVYKKKKVISIDAANHAAVKEIDGITTISRSYEGEYPQADPDLDAVTPLSTITTSARWNGTTVNDGEGNNIVTSLNMLGQKLVYDDPDMGHWTYAYDVNGNLLSQTDAKLTTITFSYDAMNRVVTKTYPNNAHIDYVYDAGGAAAHALGRLSSIAYPGGSETYTYDELGRVATISKTIAGITEPRTFSYSYHTSGLPETETLPDGEVLHYVYDNMGALNQLYGEKGGQTTNYVLSTGYTTIGKLKNIVYGNNVVTAYDYFDDTDEYGYYRSEADPSNNNLHNSFRLRNIHIQKPGNPVLADTTYEYDAVDNIKHKAFLDGYEGEFSEEFGYDDFSRLIYANGSVIQDKPIYGTKTFEYAPNNNILEKDGRSYIYNASVTRNGQTVVLPHATSAINDEYGNPLYTYQYDANGNMTGTQGQSTITIRAKKAAGGVNPRMELWLNGVQCQAWLVMNTDYENFTWTGKLLNSNSVDIIFVNGEAAADLSVNHIVVNGTTKLTNPSNAVFDRGYYYEGCVDNSDLLAAQVLLSETGALRFNASSVNTLNRSITYDYDNRITNINENGNTSSFTYDSTGMRIKKVETFNSITTTTYYFGATYEEQVQSGQPAKSISYYFANGQRIAQRTNDGTTNELLYYHTDHLGSAVRLTDTDGNPVQSIAYAPFGETVFASGVKNQPYQYTGQELDTASGLYYYKARFYSPEMGRFIQPDTVLDGLNRYAYCGNNPIIYSDPSGHFIFTPLIPFFGAILDAACWGAVIGGVGGGIVAAINGENIFTGALIGAGFGFLGGAVGGSLGLFTYSLTTHFACDATTAFISSCILGGSIGCAIIGGALGGMNSIYHGNAFGSSAFWGDVQEGLAIGGAIGSVVGAIYGYLTAPEIVNKQIQKCFEGLTDLKTDYNGDRSSGSSSNSIYYYQMLCSGSQELSISAETAFDRFGSLCLNTSGDFAITPIGAMSPYLSTLLDIVMLLPNNANAAIYLFGNEVYRYAYQHVICDTCDSWDNDLGFYKMDVGVYWKNVAKGLQLNYDIDYFISIGHDLAKATFLFLQQHPEEEGVRYQDLMYHKILPLPYPY